MVFEKDMLNDIRFFFETKGYEVFTEVPFFSKRIDLICVKDSDVIAVEMKIKDWKKALWQAYVNQLCAVKSYVAMWHEYTHRIDRKRFKKYGIGIMKIGETVDIMVKARKSSCYQISLVNRIRQEIKNNGAEYND